jgi:hypothetical protein
MLIVAIGLASPRLAGAQTVADVLTFLVTNQSVQTGSVDRDRDAAQATSDTISRALRANLATLPVTTSSGAFVYRLNPELGTVERATRSYGPFFVERALTAGRHQASFGLTFQHLRFTSLDGASLRDGSLITTANQFVDETAPFDVDALKLNIDADIATLYGNVGVTERMEIGFAAPMIALRMDGSRVNTYRGRAFTQATARASAVGLADLVVRTKYTLYDEDGAAGRRICLAQARRRSSSRRLDRSSADARQVMRTPGSASAASRASSATAGRSRWPRPAASQSPASCSDAGWTAPAISPASRRRIRGSPPSRRFA